MPPLDVAMPTRLAGPVLTLDAGKMHEIDIRNAENLFSMWTVFNRCAESIEEGRRLENLSWRLWNRETLCCEQSKNAAATPTPNAIAPETRSSSDPMPPNATPTTQGSIVKSLPPTTTPPSASDGHTGQKELPPLSHSVESLATTDDEPATSSNRDSVVAEEADKTNTIPLDLTAPPAASASPSADSAASCSPDVAGRRHISSHILERMVIDITAPHDGIPVLPSSVTTAVPVAAPASVSTLHPSPSSLPRSSSPPAASDTAPPPSHPTQSSSPDPTAAPSPSSPDRRPSQGSTSTAPSNRSVRHDRTGSSSSVLMRSATAASDTSADMITTPQSIVRGFTPCATAPALPPQRSPPSASILTSGSPASVPIRSALKPAPAAGGHNMRRGVFHLGISSEDESSLDECASGIGAPPSSLTAALHRSSTGQTSSSGISGRKKTTSFRDVVDTRTITSTANEAAIASDESDEDEVHVSSRPQDGEGDVSESAIEDDEDESDWEDSATDSGASSPGHHRSSQDSKAPMFQRVDSKPMLVSRRSLLTTQIHQSERAAALAGLASASGVKAPPTILRSRTSTPNGPSMAASPDSALASSSDEPSDADERSGGRSRGHTGLEMKATTGGGGLQIPMRSRPIQTTTNLHPPALSPRTTRRNMLATELTESLRKHLLWERQQKNTHAAAVLKRRHTAHDGMAQLRAYPQPTGTGLTTTTLDQRTAANLTSAAADRTAAASRGTSWNATFEYGGEYHSRGW